MALLLFAFGAYACSIECPSDRPYGCSEGLLEADCSNFIDCFAGGCPGDEPGARWVEVTIGPSSRKSKTVTMMEGLECPVFVDKHNWSTEYDRPDTFRIEVDGDQVTAHRQDRPSRWGMDLKFKCILNTAFEVDCDHLEVDANCVRTTTYGDDHECRITANKNVELSVSHFDVEPSSSCAYDYLQIGGTKYCGNTDTPNGVRVSPGDEFIWSTDHSVTKLGWEICVRDYLWEKEEVHTRWCSEGNHDDFTMESSSHPMWAHHAGSGYGYRWCAVTVDECKELSQGIDGVIGFYYTTNMCCFPMKNQCFGDRCPGHGCDGADSGTYMIIDQEIEHLDGSTWCPHYTDRESCLGARDGRPEWASACGWCCGDGCADGAGWKCEPTKWLTNGAAPPFVNALGHDTCTGSGPVFSRYQTDSTFPITAGTTGSLGMEGSSFTAAAWVYLTEQHSDEQGDHAIFGGAVAYGENRALHLQVRNGRYYMGFYRNDCSGGLSVLNEWQHAVFVYDFPTRRQMIYVNGVLVNTCEDKAPLEGDDTVLLGSWANGRLWEGQIKGAKIYDYAVTPDAVADMYSFGSGTSPFELNDIGILMFEGGYVCDDGFGDEEGSMVCATFGLQYDGHRAQHTVPEANFSMDELNCPAGATTLDECSFYTNHDCSRYEAVQVDCIGQRRLEEDKLRRLDDDLLIQETRAPTEAFAPLL